MQYLNSANLAAVMNIMLKNTRGTTTTEDGAESDGLIVKEDLSNLTDGGNKLTSSLTVGNFRNALTGMLETVGHIIYENAKKVSPSRFNIYTDIDEFMSILEKVRIGSIDFEQSYKYATSGGSSFEDMFNNHPLTFTVKVWNTMGSYRTKPYTISLDQLKTSVQTREGLTRLVSEIYGVVQATYYTALRAAETRVIMCQAASAAMYDKKNNKTQLVIDVLQEYKKFCGVTLTTETMKTSDDFKRWIYGFIKHIRVLMKEATPNFNAENNVIETDGDDFRAFILEPYRTSIETISKYEDGNANRDAFNGFSEIAFIQNFNDFDKIDVVPVDAPVITPSKHVTRVQFSDVFGMIWDKRGTLIASPGIETGVVHNDYDKWDNYVHLFDIREMCDKGSNCVVLVAHDASGTEKAYTITEENDA